MSAPENPVVRAAYAAMNARDLPGLLATLDPEIEWMPSRQFPGEHPYRGHDGVTRHFSELWDDFAVLAFDVEEEHARPGDVVVVIGRLRSRGRSSGVEVGYRFGHVWRLRGGKVARVEIYLTPGEALEAAGD